MNNRLWKKAAAAATAFVLAFSGAVVLPGSLLGNNELTAAGSEEVYTATMKMPFNTHFSDNISVTLKDDLALNFYIEAPFAMPEKYTVIMHGKCDEDNKAVPVVAYIPDDISEYRVTANVSANNMDEEITAELYIGDKLLDTKTCSVSQYLEKAAETVTDGDLLDLIIATQNYGKAAENYFNGADNDLSSIDWTIDTIRPESDPNEVQCLDESAKLSLVLDSRLKARLYIEGAAEGDNALFNDTTLTAKKSKYGVFFETPSFTPTALYTEMTITYNDESYKFYPVTWIMRMLLKTGTSKTEGEDIDITNNRYLASTLFMYMTIARNYANTH